MVTSITGDVLIRTVWALRGNRQCLLLTLLEPVFLTVVAVEAFGLLVEEFWVSHSCVGKNLRLVRIQLSLVDQLGLVTAIGHCMKPFA